MPMILRFGLLMESLSYCIFLSQLLNCLTKISFVFFFNYILSLSSKIVSSTWCCATMFLIGWLVVLVA
jgi:hypothetical protein